MIVWMSWSNDAFVRAQQSAKPLLVVVGPDVAARVASAEVEINSRFIPVTVDPDVRPDVAARVGADRAVVLSPDGIRRAVLPLPAENLVPTLRRLAVEASVQFAGRPDDSGAAWTGAVRAQAQTPAPSDEEIAAAFSRLSGNEISNVAGLGALTYAAIERPQLPSSELICRGLATWVETFWDNRLGQFRAGPALSLTGYVRRALLAWDAHALLGEYKWRTIAEATTNILREELFDSTVGACRQQLGVDVYPAQGNALAALAALRAAAYGVPGAGAVAQSCLKFLQSVLYDPLLGMTHARGGEGGEVHGLLGDAAWTALTFSEAYLLTGDKSHREFADDLVQFLFQELWDRENGGFLDRIVRRDDPAILREILIDPELNAVALEVCWRLHHMKGVMNYRRWLDLGLNSVWSASNGNALAQAQLARVADMARRGRSDFELVGRFGEEKGLALLQALRRCFVPRAIVSFVDPDDQDYILAHKLSAETYPRLFGCAADLRRVADTDDPNEVSAVVDAVRDTERR